MQINMKSLFDEISKREGHTFEVNKFYNQKAELYLPDENGEDVKIKAMIIKEDNIIELSTEKGILEIGSRHVIMTNQGLKYGDSLLPGHILKTVDGECKINGIRVKGTDIVYDISVDSDTMLYSDANGIIHHNTYHIESTLTNMLGGNRGASAKWVMKTGALSPFALYQILYFNRDKIIFFDDADAVWKTEDTVNMLKAALDTRPVRRVGWDSSFTTPVNGLEMDAIIELENTIDDLYETDPTKIGKGKYKLPNEFEFTGAVIFTSNKSGAFFEKIGGGAIRSRSLFVDIELKAEDTLNRIKTIGIAKGFDPDTIEEVLDALKDKGDLLTIRAMEIAMKFKNAGMSNWGDLTKRYA